MHSQSSIMAAHDDSPEPSGEILSGAGSGESPSASSRAGGAGTLSTNIPGTERSR